MQEQIRAMVSAYLSRLWGGCREYVQVMKDAAFWRNMAAQSEPWKARGIALLQQMPTWRVRLAVIIILLGLILVVHHAVSSSETANKDGVVPEERAVLCIGVVRYRNGVKDAFFQRPGESIEALLMERKDAAQVSEGFTVEHRDCYESWQAAADFLTDGQVTLPDNANEAIFSMTVLKWKQQQMQAGN